MNQNDTRFLKVKSEVNTVSGGIRNEEKMACGAFGAHFQTFANLANRETVLDNYTNEEPFQIIELFTT